MDQRGNSFAAVLDIEIDQIDSSPYIESFEDKSILELVVMHETATKNFFVLFKSFTTTSIRTVV